MYMRMYIPPSTQPHAPYSIPKVLRGLWDDVRKELKLHASLILPTNAH